MPEVAISYFRGCGSGWQLSQQLFGYISSFDRLLNVKTLINYGYFLKVINIKKEKLFPKIFRFRQNRNLVEKSAFAKQKSVLVKRKFIKKIEKYIINCMMLTFLRLSMNRFNGTENIYWDDISQHQLSDQEIQNASTEESYKSAMWKQKESFAVPASMKEW